MIVLHTTGAFVSSLPARFLLHHPHSHTIYTHADAARHTCQLLLIWPVGNQAQPTPGRPLYSVSLMKPGSRRMGWCVSQSTALHAGKQHEACSASHTNTACLHAVKGKDKSGVLWREVGVQGLPPAGAGRPLFSVSLMEPGSRRMGWYVSQSTALKAGIHTTPALACCIIACKHEDVRQWLSLVDTQAQPMPGQSFRGVSLIK